MLTGRDVFWDVLWKMSEYTSRKYLGLDDLHSLCCLVKFSCFFSFFSLYNLIRCIFFYHYMVNKDEYKRFVSQELYCQGNYSRWTRTNTITILNRLYNYKYNINKLYKHIENKSKLSQSRLSATLLVCMVRLCTCLSLSLIMCFLWYMTMLLFHLLIAVAPFVK